jgi:pyridoxamine 5'-phosphate oxidase-like protein
MGDSERQVRQLSRERALRKLGSVPVGRIVFTHHALPAVRPVNHVLHDGQLIIRTYEGTAIVGVTSRQHGTVVVYEADEIDPATRTGWTVTVTGVAHLVRDAEKAARLRQRLRPWVAGEMSYVICIDPQVVSGFELIASHPATPP